MSDQAVPPRLLDADLLGQLESRWRAQGAFIAEALRPGLSDSEMDRLTEPLGIRLPREARVWWGTHDGADKAPNGRNADFGPDRDFLPLAQAVERCLEWRDTMEFPDHPGWSEGYLPLDGDKVATVIDCSVGFDEPVPVRAVQVTDEDASGPGLRSMGELVEFWIRLIDARVWVYNPKMSAWQLEAEVSPQDADFGLE